MLDRFATMQTFVRVVDGGSLSAAARELGRSLAAVSRTVSEIESRLGVPLLNRSTRRLPPTEARPAYCCCCCVFVAVAARFFASSAA